ncbi:lipolysis-stimulated lipoprotein receptor-like isoform X2 [Corythoichthys intestinalis]|uniref:lipolysis-stimulated lipoprotein receptor-like isoform X2 n=1 Tax=Corythoichthys intestinalis TaxID=161448 RepID=UPI0025A5F5B3|nr:lipolysis-stimulated lipoprotein receptor-like isoform X2 [Corythoichthys intestinalis]
MKNFWAFFIVAALATESVMAVSVSSPTKRYVVILFQPVTLTCKFQTTATQAPVVTWRYKSYCRDPVQAALNPSNVDNILSQNNPNYDPNIECADSQRTVRIVASKQGSAVTLGTEYQGRKISIINDADLNIAQTAWGDSGVYVCSVISSQDLTGNGEDYTELIVLDWLLVVVVVLAFLLLLLLIGICWCQCCPHTCCCYVSCPCCPDKCCCPRALYEAGKAVKKGVTNHYATTVYAPSMYAQPAYGGPLVQQPAMPMLPLPKGVGVPPSQNGYGREYDGTSSVGQGSQVPLLHDQDGVGGDHTRSGYRIQVDPDGNATRAIYYMERELANLDPSRPANYNRLDNVSEVTSLHDSADPRSRGGRSQPPPLSTVYDDDEGMSTISSVSQHVHRRQDDRRGYMDDRARARSMDNLDDIGRRYGRDDYLPRRRADEPRGRRGSDDEWSSSGRAGYDRDERRRRDYSPDDYRRGGGGGGYGALPGRRSRSRDDLMDLERDRRPGGGRDRRDDYDDSFLREAMERKRLGEQQRARSRDRLESDGERSDRGRAPAARGPPPLPLNPPAGPGGLPPPYSDDESMTSSKKSNMRKNGAVSRESLVV